MLDDLSIDANTGQTHLTIGCEVVVKDEAGKQHTGLITDIGTGTDPLFNVMLTCRGKTQDVLVPESQLLARVVPSAEWDI